MSLLYYVPAINHDNFAVINVRPFSIGVASQYLYRTPF